MEKIKLDVECSCGLCEDDEYYQCKGCKRLVSYCCGGSDKYWEYCDDCWCVLTFDFPPQSLLELIQSKTSSTFNSRLG